MKNIVFIVILIILVFLTPQKLGTFDADLNFSYSILYFISLIYFLIIHSRTNANWFRFDVFFLIGFTIVHFQIPFIASLGTEPSNPYYIWINKLVVNFATWMSVVAINLWMLGYTLTKSKQKGVIKEVNPEPLRVNLVKFDILLGISFVSFLLFVGRTFFTGEVQGSESWGGGAVYIFLIFSKLLFLRIIYFVMQMPKNLPVFGIFKRFFSNKIFTAVLVATTVLFLLIGDRGPVMKIILIAGGAYALYVNPIKFKSLMLVLVLGTFVFTLLGLGRGDKSEGFGENNIFERGYVEYVDHKDDTNLTNELASSVRIQYRALDVVPETHPYLYGSTYIFSFTNVIPFAGGTIIDLFDVPAIYTDSSVFFTFLGQGNQSTYGEGSEVLADVYINFGLAGVFLVLFLFGIFSKRIADKCSSKDLRYVIVYMAFLMSAVYINRSFLLYPLKDIVYMLFFNFLFTRIIK